MLVMALRTANDLFGILVLPPILALIVLADLVLSVGLLVAILRELPHFLESERGSRPSA